MNTSEKPMTNVIDATRTWRRAAAARPALTSRISSSESPEMNDT
jgi:hypothetical protein